VAINNGVMEYTCDDGDLTIRIYYDANAPHSTPEEMNLQPLVNGPRGFCLDVTNVSGRKRRITIREDSDGDGQPDVVLLTAEVQQGNPVTSGPQEGRSKTAAQMAAAGFTTRGSVGNIQLDC
jgi:hypothetical protein